MACNGSQQRSKTRVKTEFVKVGHQVVHLDLHTLETDSQIPDASLSWPSSSDVKEILQLLQTALEERLLRASNIWHCHDTAHKPVATKPCVISGEKVRIAYSFKNKSVHQKCLLPERGGQYSGFPIFREKVVVYACPLDTQRKEQTRLSSASKESLPLSSSYFSRQSKVETDVAKGPQAALRNIIQKSGPKLSKIKHKQDINKKKVTPSAISVKKSCEEIQNESHQLFSSRPVSGTDSIQAVHHKGKKNSEKESCHGNASPESQVQENTVYDVEDGTTDSSQRKPHFSEICEDVNDLREYINGSSLPKINESVSSKTSNSRGGSMKGSSVLEFQQKLDEGSDTTSISSGIEERHHSFKAVSEQAVKAATEMKSVDDLPGYKTKKWNFKLSVKHKNKHKDLNNLGTRGSSKHSKINVCGSDGTTGFNKDKETCGLVRQTIVDTSEDEPKDLKQMHGSLNFQLGQADQSNTALEEEWGTDVADQDFCDIDMMPQTRLTEDFCQQDTIKEQEELNLSSDNSETLPECGLNSAAVLSGEQPDNPCVTSDTGTLPPVLRHQTSTSDLVPWNVLEPSSTSETMEKELTGNRNQSQTTPNRTRRRKHVTGRHHINQRRKKPAAKRLPLLDSSEEETTQEDTRGDKCLIYKSSIKEMLQPKKIAGPPRLSTDLPSASFVLATRCKQDTETEVAFLQQGVASLQHVKSDGSGSEDAPEGLTAGLSPVKPGKDQIQVNTKADDSQTKPLLRCKGTSVKRTASDSTTLEPTKKWPRRAGIYKRLMNLYNPDFNEGPASQRESPVSDKAEEDEQLATSQSHKPASHNPTKSKMRQLQKCRNKKTGASFPKGSLFMRQCDAKRQECPWSPLPGEGEKGSSNEQVNAFSLMIRPKSSKKIMGIGSQLVDVGYLENPGVMAGSLEDEVRSVSNVAHLSESQLAFMVTRMEPYLRDIFTGKSFCMRHQDYKGGGKACSDLSFQIPMKCFEDDQRDIIMDLLLAMFCRKHNRYLDYVLKVMLPECLVKIYMDVHNVDHASAETVLCPPPPVIGMPSRNPQLPNSC